MTNPGLTFCGTSLPQRGAFTQTAVTPTDTGGAYDWVNQGNGLYTIEMPASGGGTINNDTEGFGWFTGFATGILPWAGPIIGFRAAGINNRLIDDADSVTRGLAGTALPAAAADAAGGLPISDAGGLDLDNLADKIWDEAKAGHTAGGSFGEEVQAHALEVTLDAQNDLSAAQVNTEADTANTDYGAVKAGTTLTESYAANGVAPTLEQAVFAIHQYLMQFGIVGTSYTVRKLNDSDTAFVVTLDDAADPTDAKRV